MLQKVTIYPKLVGIVILYYTATEVAISPDELIFSFKLVD